MEPKSLMLRAASDGLCMAACLEAKLSHFTWHKLLTSLVQTAMGILRSTQRIYHNFDLLTTLVNNDRRVASGMNRGDSREPKATPLTSRRHYNS